MGGRKEVAEEVGHSSRQADRKDQRIGGCAEASDVAEGHAEQVCKEMGHFCELQHYLNLLSM